jgi:hypothetical protein
MCLWINRPYYFEQDNCTVTVTSEQDYIMLKLLELDSEKQIQQYGATAYRVRVLMNCLQFMFPGHLISHHDTAWPSRLPDLTAPKFFILGHSKPEVYNNKPWTIMEEKEHMVDETIATDVMLLELWRISNQGFKNVSYVMVST